MSQLEEDIGTILGIVRTLPTRSELDACEERIRTEVRSFGTTVGGDIGRLLQRYEDLERRVRLLEDKKPNGAAERPRPARVR